MPVWQGSIAETIAFLVSEGKPRAQAIAIALDEARSRGVSKAAEPVEGTITFEIVKANDERRLLTAITNIVTDSEGKPVVDHQGDVIKIDNLEQSFIDAFSIHGGMGMGGTMHRNKGGVDVVQHFTLSKGEREALGFGPGPEMGIVKLRVTDDQIWADVKAGKYPEVSIGGEGERSPL